MANISRRNFLQGAAATGALAALAGCDTPAASDPSAAPAADSYPIEPEEWGSGEPKYAVEKTSDGYSKVTQEGGTTLGIADESKLIQVAGFAFKDLNGNGKLDLWEDWRQDTTARAEALAKEMDISLVLRQMNSGSFRSSEGGFSEGGAELTDDQKKDIDEGYTNRKMMTFSTPIKDYVPWFNEMQAYAESANTGIPVVFECEAFQGNATMGPGGVYWPTSPTVAATFDMENACEVGKGLSRVLRGFGATKANSPQSDIGTEPTWDRNSGTFCGDPALGRDMANGFISGCQSHYDENGEDQGWGRTSLLCNMKHFPGDGAAQFGGNSHNRQDRFDIYPNKNFGANWVPFIDGGLHLDSKTGQCASAMPFYSIPYTEDGEYGELVGGGFSKFVMSLGRAYGFEGMYSSDWGIIGDWSTQGRPWGVENLSMPERLAKSYEAGMCLIVDDNAYDIIDETWELMKKDMGEEEAEACVRDSVMRIERTTMNLGLFENPYLDLEESKELIDADQYEESMEEILLKGIVMLKNDGAISEGCMSDKPKVYVPLKYSAGMGGPGDGFFMGGGGGEATPTASLPVDEEILSQYFTVVTDTAPEELTSEDDITRADSAALADCKYALLLIDAPSSANSAGMGETVTEFYPRTLQYRPFTADDASGCPEEAPAGTDASGYDYENCSPYGMTTTTSNEADLDLVINTKKALPEGAKLIVVTRTSNPVMCYYELEPYADAIITGNSNTDENYLKIASGEVEPTGLLPWGQPKNMTAVYMSATDTPRDEECYTDAMGNTYEFGFGLNWSGVIDDDRTKKYKDAEPLLAPESEMDESLLIK